MLMTGQEISNEQKTKKGLSQNKICHSERR